MADEPKKGDASDLDKKPLENQDPDLKGDNKDNKQPDDPSKIEKLSSKVEQVIGRATKAEKERDEALLKLKDLEEAEMKEKGEFKDLADQKATELLAANTKLEDLEAQIKESDEAITKLLKIEIENIPEENRSLIPEDYTPRKKLNWIIERRELLTGKKSVSNQDLPKNDSKVTEIEAKRKRVEDLKEKGRMRTEPEEYELVELSRELTKKETDNT